MLGRWTNWKPFPNRGENIEAPIGPGVYEVCHAATGEQVAFGSSANIAQSLSDVLPQPGRTWPFFRRAARPRYTASELEYRTCATGTLSEAKVAVGQMLSQRQALLRRFSPAAKH